MMPTKLFTAVKTDPRLRLLALLALSMAFSVTMNAFRIWHSHTLTYLCFSGLEFVFGGYSLRHQYVMGSNTLELRSSLLEQLEKYKLV